MRSSIGVVDAILVEAEKRRRDSRPGIERGSIGTLRVQLIQDGGGDYVVCGMLTGWVRGWVRFWVRREERKSESFVGVGGLKVFPRNFIRMTSMTSTALPLHSNLNCIFWNGADSTWNYDVLLLTHYNELYI